MLKEESLYLFGISGGLGRIILFKPETLEFEEKEVPGVLKISKYMSSCWSDQNQIYLSGGISSDLSSIKSDFFVYFPTDNFCEKLKDSNQARYTHSTIFKDGKVFIIGGRFYGTDFDSLLSHVEAYDIETKTWKILAPMFKRRCTLFSFIYLNQIFVCGGYSGNLKRTKKFERYNEEKDFWELFSVKLPLGLECGLIFSLQNDEICFLGGNTNVGSTNRCLKINLRNRTLLQMQKMNTGRALQKGMFYKDELIVFGGEKDNSTFIEKFVPNSEMWSTTSQSFGHFISSDEIKGFCSSNVSLEVFSNEDTEPKDPFEGERFFVFGNDLSSFILEVRVQEEEILNLPVPVDLRLFNYQAGVKISENEIFIAGGISSSLDFISKTAVIYNMKHGSVEKLNKMYHERYSFTVVYYDSFIYVFGGRTYQGDEFALLKNCERFDLTTKMWEQICSMSERKCSTMGFLFQDEIYLCGGYIGFGTKSDKIERYHTAFDSWDLLSVSMKVSIEASCPLQINDKKVLFFGGKNENDEDQNVYSFDPNTGLEIVGQLDSPKFLLKAYRFYDNRNILLFGGKLGVQIATNFNTEKMEIDNEEKSFICEKLIESIRNFAVEKDVKTYLLV